MFSQENLVVAEIAYPNRDSITLHSQETTHRTLPDTGYPSNDIIILEPVEENINDYSTEIIFAEDATLDNSFDSLFNPSIYDIIYNYFHIFNIFNILGSRNNYNNQLTLLQERSEILYKFIYQRDVIVQSCIGSLFLNILYTFLNPFNIVNFLALLLNVCIISHSSYNMYQTVIALNIFSMIYILLTNLSLTLITYTYYFIPAFKNNSNYTISVIYLILLYIFSFIINIIYIKLINNIFKLKIFYKQLIRDQIININT